ncbi:GlmU family protein [Chryseolinea sp. H1M3-3]|uniref:GlmU family protein n=1 Tax=Chryseolinea sp. H1M3-3 TaxID=3034144 RepID=UPI0023EB2559|nr:GlmU family protein [Chryseolinea sp. H1M3-3]
MNIILFDDPAIRMALLPFTFTRPVSGVRVGIMTIAEKWQKRLGVEVSYKTEDYLQRKFPIVSTLNNLLINGAICPDDLLLDTVRALPDGYYLVNGSLLIAARNPEDEMTAQNTIEYENSFTIIDHTWKIFRENADQLKKDFKLLTQGRKSFPIKDRYTAVYNEENIFVEEGVTILAAVLNAESGPIYLGKNSVVQEGVVIRGSFALCDNAQVNMGAKIRGDTTIGPYCKIGGEVSNSVIFGNSNKAHDGYLGNSVLGEWCNLGAGTNTSNLKNNYDTVKLWSHVDNGFKNTGLQFCGLMMGDHSKSGISTMFNTGTVVDVCANIFGSGMPPNYVPSFAWGGANGFTTYKIEKAFDTINKVMSRRNADFSEDDQDILAHLFKMTLHTRV